MITFNNQFQFERDQYGWSLHIWREGKDKDGKPKRHKDTRYYANLAQVFEAMIDVSAGNCSCMGELTNLITAMRFDADNLIKAMRP